METITTFRKVCRIGVGPYGSVYVVIKYTDGKLSFTGVEGPTPSGNCKGACGQIDMHPWGIVEYAGGWNADSEARLRELWGRWHLNDMKAGCEHQRGWDTTRKVKIYHWKLTSEGCAEKSKAEDKVMKAAKTSETVTVPQEVRDWLNRPYSLTSHTDTCPGDGSFYKLDKIEEKTLGWLKPDEHPDGMLCKPCPECGYKYGTEWRKEEVPAAVLDEIQSWPDTDRQPAWC